jgi:cell wall-associated NlpC family hydrolase
MSKRILGVLIAGIFLLGSCTSLKQLGFTGVPSNAEPAKPVIVNNNPAVHSNVEIKFLDDISASLQPVSVEVTSLNVNYSKNAGPSTGDQGDNLTITRPISFYEEKNTESFSALQYKYAAILGTDAWYISNATLFEFIDDWYGTRYCMGGTSKSCIDCSAIVQIMFSEIYNTAVPRTAREQYKVVKRISLTELQEGDLLFFNTRGRGISHVGVYLANNKFFHSATSSGVMISDMYEPYFIKRLAGAGRIIK